MKMLLNKIRMLNNKEFLKGFFGVIFLFLYLHLYNYVSIFRKINDPIAYETSFSHGTQFEFGYPFTFLEWYSPHSVHFYQDLLILNILCIAVTSIVFGLITKHILTKDSFQDSSINYQNHNNLLFQTSINTDSQQQQNSKEFKLYNGAFKIGFVSTITVFVVLNFISYFNSVVKDENRIQFSNYLGPSWGFPVTMANYYNYSGIEPFLFSFNVLITVICGFITGFIFRYVWSKLQSNPIK